MSRHTKALRFDNYVVFSSILCFATFVCLHPVTPNPLINFHRATQKGQETKSSRNPNQGRKPESYQRYKAKENTKK